MIANNVEYEDICKRDYEVYSMCWPESTNEGLKN